jgi:hypothetical protein
LSFEGKSNIKRALERILGGEPVPPGSNSPPLKARSDPKLIRPGTTPDEISPRPLASSSPINKSVTTLRNSQNIWLEKRNSSGAIILDLDTKNSVFEVTAGTLNQLIMKLTSEVDCGQEFVSTFIYTYRSFTTPDELMFKLLERYHVPPSVQLSAQDVKAIQLRVVNAIKRWIQVAVQDFLDDGELLLSLHNFIKELELDGYTGLAAQLQKNLNTKIDEVTTNAEKYFFLRARFQDDGASSSSSDPDLGRPANDIGEISILTALSTNPFPGGKDYFMDMTHEDIAKYLTTVESALFRSIQPLELLNQAWNKPSLQYRAKNVCKLINRFNQVSSWVGLTILAQISLKMRVKVIEKFIKVAKWLDKFNNYNSLMAIIAGLNTSSISRIKFTWAEVNKKHMDEYKILEAKMSSENSYKNYREALRNAIPPIVPYIGVFLSDLTMIEEGNPDLIQDLINFKKRDMIYQVIEKVLRYQQDAYNFQCTDEKALNAFVTLPHMKEQLLYNKSLEIEPRGVENKRDLLKLESKSKRDLFA